MEAFSSEYKLSFKLLVYGLASSCLLGGVTFGFLARCAFDAFMVGGSLLTRAPAACAFCSLAFINLFLGLSRGILWKERRGCCWPGGRWRAVVLTPVVDIETRPLRLGLARKLLLA